MKRLLYIGHEYHAKTKSVAFLLDILQQEYELEFCTVDPLLSTSVDGLSSIEQKTYDVLLCFQVMPSIVEIKKHLSFKRGVLFPMYDFYYSSTPLDNPIWNEYRDFLTINFSRALHYDLSKAGFCSRYIQYFPKPADSFDWGDERAVYLWQRVSDINIYLVDSLLGNYDYRKIHIHQAIDPGQNLVPIPDNYFKTKEVSLSTWYENSEESRNSISQAAIYMAPRYHEGIGLSFLEAMAMGRCVIAMDNPTMNEYIVHGQSGLLYPMHDPHKPLEGTWDIRYIQRNAYEYVSKGYDEWEKNKGSMLQWMRDELTIDSVKLERTARACGWLAPRRSFFPMFMSRIKTGLRWMVSTSIGNLMRKLFNSFFGRGIRWEGYTYFIFGFIPLYSVLYGNAQTILRIEVLGLPIWELREEEIG